MTTFFWKNLECELCKTQYPYEVNLPNQQKLNIIDYDKPPEKELDSFGRMRPNYYLTLESISTNSSKVIHVVNMDEIGKMYIGRGHDAQVRVTDISVSRLHAALVRSVHGYFFLQDN